MKKCILGLIGVLPCVLAPAGKAAIVDAYNGGAGSYPISGTVTSVLNVSGTANTFTVQDGTGSAIAYNITKANYTATVGDTVSFTATNSPYQGAPEFINTGFSLAGPATAGTAPTPPVLTIPQFKASGNGSVGVVPYSEAVITLTNVSILNKTGGLTAYPSGALATNTTYVLTDALGNMTNFYGYASDSAVVAAITAANANNPGGYSGTYTITGYADEYYGGAEIYPLAITETSTAPVPEPASMGLLAIAGAALMRRRASR